jgi:hypothetical protein
MMMVTMMMMMMMMITMMVVVVVMMMIGKALDSQAERYWVRSLPLPQKALNMIDY